MVDSLTYMANCPYCNSDIFSTGWNVEEVDIDYKTIKGIIISCKECHKMLTIFQAWKREPLCHSGTVRKPRMSKNRCIYDVVTKDVQYGR